jgi:REP element-mobilizing transposase RayT
MQYRRDLTTGATYFFTVVTFRRSRFFAQGENIEQLRAAFRDEKERRPFHIDAIVILPDHIHAIWTLPPDDANYSMRWRNIKRSFTATVSNEQRPSVFARRKQKKEQAIYPKGTSGNGGFGSIASGMSGILKTMLIISITIRLRIWSKLTSRNSPSSFPCSAWECRLNRSCGSGRRASLSGFPRRAWEP